MAASTQSNRRRRTVQLMTQADFARHRGVVKSAVSNWKKAGLLVLAEDPLDGRIKVDATRTDAKLNAKLDPMRGRPSTGLAPTGVAPSPLPSPPEGGEGALPLDPPPSNGARSSNINDERLGELRERRIGTALKNAQLAGDLVPLVEAERRVNEAGRAARERIHAWSRGAAERLAATSDVRVVMTLCEEGIDQVFAELAAAAQRGDFAGDDEDLSPEEEAEIEAAAIAEDATAAE